MRAILFDCDGTIADTLGLICEAMRRVFVAHALPAPGDAATRAIVGLSLETAIARLHPDGETALHGAMAETYRSTFRSTRDDAQFRETLFDGVRDMLDALRSREEVLLGLVTGKSRRGVTAICTAHGLTDHFQVVRTADDCPSKPHPAMVLECCDTLGIRPRDALVIGDAVYDIEMAKAAGSDAIGVAWGAGKAETLLAAGALSVASNVAALALAIDAWLDAGSAVAAPDGAATTLAGRAF
ncbi:HAD-IA family hydrolase [Mangrovicella endophytica]|uniref:HAD-IA family hydrolase n=1 Tax=Mangrovicella endophytica TaxID=2066697 RepID=UPI000C9E327F|nr:HAD-IA family hydrolase [Mangrovicella endophytica]